MYTGSMSRTQKGNLTGKAASTELREQREYLADEDAERRHRFGVEWRWNMRRLRRLDHNWELWYDERPEETTGAMLPVIKQRIEELKAAHGR